MRANNFQIASSSVSQYSNDTVPITNKYDESTRFIYQQQLLITRYQALAYGVEQAEHRINRAVLHIPPVETLEYIKQFFNGIKNAVIATIGQLISASDSQELTDYQERLYQISKSIEAEERKLNLRSNQIYKMVIGESRELILKAFRALKAECNLHTPYIPKDIEIDWHEHSTPLQQQKIVTDQHESIELLKILDKVKTTFTVPSFIIDCFISYAWPSKGRLDEVFVQPFLLALASHLEKAGITTYLDIKNSRYGFDAYVHMQRIESSNTVLLIGTRSLLDKFSQGLSAVCYELI